MKRMNSSKRRNVVMFQGMTMVTSPVERDLGCKVGV